MKISEANIRLIMGNAKESRIKDFVSSFNTYAEMFGINTPLRAAHYIAQVAHETNELRWLEELASGKDYDTGRKAQQLGNTPQADGDGQRFKGRGYLQLTGRVNYKAYASSKYCVGDLMSHPEWLAKQPGCQKSAMWFWQSRGLNELADLDKAEAITKRINGGTKGLAQRLYYLRKAKGVFFI